MSEVEQQPGTDSSNTVQLVYILYLVGLVIGITCVVGVIMAYVNRDEAQDWLKVHYQFQIRTFWIGALYVGIGVLTTPLFGLGVLVMIFWMIWVIIRCVLGMKALEKKQAPANPTTWLIG